MPSKWSSEVKRDRSKKFLRSFLDTGTENPLRALGETRFLGTEFETMQVTVEPQMVYKRKLNIYLWLSWFRILGVEAGNYAGKKALTEKERNVHKVMFTKFQPASLSGARGERRKERKNIVYPASSIWFLVMHPADLQFLVIHISSPPLFVYLIRFMLTKFHKEDSFSIHFNSVVISETQIPALRLRFQ